MAASGKWLFVHGRGDQRFDLVHVHNVPDFLIFSALPAKLRGAPLILDIHDIVPEFFASKFQASPQSFLVRSLKWVEFISARLADHVILSNHLWLDRYTQRSASPEKCSVFINHVDRRIFRPQERLPRSGGPIVIYPGGLQWHQGLDIAIRAFALLKQRLPEARFHIYGEGACKGELIELANELGLKEEVKFFEPMSMQAIARVVAKADLGVVPKRANTFGNEAYSTKIMEFMSLGVPVVVSDTQVDRYYFDESLVRFFRSGDEQDLAQTMYEVLTDSQLRASMIRRANEYVEIENWDNYKGKYLGLVDALIARRPVPRDTLVSV